VIALGDVSVAGKEIAVTHPALHSPMPTAALVASAGFRSLVTAESVQQVDVSTCRAGLTCVITLEDGSAPG
jgi:hypothetical protein